jgi:hypothetical protein
MENSSRDNLTHDSESGDQAIRRKDSRSIRILGKIVEKGFKSVALIS